MTTTNRNGNGRGSSMNGHLNGNAIVVTPMNDVPRIDTQRVADDIATRVRDIVVRDLKRRGVVVALSGGIDSSATAGLAVRALGKERVFGLLMPEADSAEETTPLGESVARALGIAFVVEDITPALTALGCYRRRDDAIKSVVGDYGPGWK